MNFLDLYCEYAGEFTDSPASFHHRIGLSILSTVIGRKLFIWQGYKRIFPNIWLIIVAPSSFYRKSYSLGIAENVLRDLKEKTQESYILPREFSHERFVEILASHPQGLLIAYEFKTFMAMMSRDYMSGTQAMITELFDNPPIYNREIKSGTFEIRDPFLNILAATTMDWFISSMKDDDQAGGFLPRFLVASHVGKKDKKMAWQPLADMTKKYVLIEKLVEISKLCGACKVAEDAKEYYEDWYAKFEDSYSKPGRLSPFYARLQEYAKKLSILICVNESENINIELNHIKSACKIAETYAREITRMMEDDLTPTSKGQRKVIEALKTAGHDGLSREELIRKTRLLAGWLNPILETFIESKQVKATMVKRKNLSNAECEKMVYFWQNGSYED